MIVTKIEEFKKGRYRVYIDGERRFILYRGELRSYKITEGEAVSQNTYELICGEVLPKRAKLRAMNLLMKHRFTEKGLRDKLREGEYPEEIINEAIEYVISYGYVDDEGYALDYAQYHKSNKSIARIKNDLCNKGIDKEIINKVLNQISESDDPVDEEGQIRRLLEKKHYNPEIATYEEKQKIYAYLCRKGFTTESIRRTMQVLDIT